jgi:hypothetical protein
MNEGMSKLSVSESLIKKQIEPRQEFAAFQERSIDIRLKTQELLKKHPDILKTQRYSMYLEEETYTMNSGSKKSLNTKGHLAEKDLLNDVYIKDNDHILVLNQKGLDEKEKVFLDLVDFFGNESFQKKEECRLGKFSKGYLYSKFEKAGKKVEDIKFFTAVGTPLDFNFGVDGWVEIKSENGEGIKIFFDVKTGGYPDISPGPFADLICSAKENEGEIVFEESTLKIKSFLDSVVQTYESKSRLAQEVV